MKIVIRKYGYHIAICMIALIIFAANYKPGTFLTGWDSLQTELNPGLAVKRAIFSVWEEYQSFGLVSGMAHAADLVRALVLYPLSFIVPAAVMRYLFHTAMLLVGGIGMFELLQYTGLSGKRKLFAFIGALFYMLNFGTVQILYIPFEPFSIFLGMAPWQILAFIRYIKRDRKYALPVLTIINILATPQAYVQTIFVVYMLLLAGITAGMSISHRSQRFIKRAVAAAFIIITLNLFWILPQIYFLKTSEKVVENAKISQIMTDDVYYQNKEKSTFSHFFRMEGYYYDLAVGNKETLFLPWKDYFQHAELLIVSYMVAGIWIVGMLKKNKYRMPFLIVMGMVAVAFLLAIPPFSWINMLIRMNHTVNQIFRAPFTKFIIPYALAASFFFAYGVELISDRVDRIFRPVRHAHYTPVSSLTVSVTHYVAALSAVAMLTVCALPVFTGNMFAPSLKVAIPDEYMRLMQFFNKEDHNKRVALLPDYTFWGWFVHDWGYTGSGFLWYGIEQPIVSRNFDYWSSKSESYFWETKDVTENGNREAFEKLLEKYDIDYLVLDLSLAPVTGTAQRIQYDKVRAMLASSDKVSLVKKLPHIMVYQVDRHTPVNAFVSVAKSLPDIGPYVDVMNSDTAYLENGIYKTTDAAHVYYPFINLMTQVRTSDAGWHIGEDEKYVFANAAVPYAVAGYEISKKISTEQIVFNTDEVISVPKEQSKAVVYNDSVIAYVPKSRVGSYAPYNTEIDNCGVPGADYSLTKKGGSAEVTSSDGAIGCFTYTIPPAKAGDGMLIHIRNTNIQGRRPFFYLLNNATKQSYIEDRLQSDSDYFVVPPQSSAGQGYLMIFNNNSYENMTSVNRIDGITIYMLPMNEIQSIIMKQKGYSAPTPTFSDTFASGKAQYFDYVVRTTETDATIILYQQYHPGWQAYAVSNDTFVNRYAPFLKGTRVGSHMPINNWANGWDIKGNAKSQTYVLIFWPQYLEFAGLAILIMAMPVFLRKSY